MSRALRVTDFGVLVVRMKKWTTTWRTTGSSIRMMTQSKKTSTSKISIITRRVRLKLLSR